MCDIGRCLARSFLEASSHRAGFASPTSSYHIASSFPAARALIPPPVMASKRKKPATTPITPETSIDEKLSRGRLRRSGRLLDRAGQALIPQPTQYLKASMQAGPDQKVVERDWLLDKAGVEVMQSGLQEIEDQLRDDVKRQKKAVQEGEALFDGPDEDVKTVELKPGYGSFLPRLIHTMPGIIPANRKMDGLKKRSVRRPQATQTGLDDAEDREVREETEGAFNNENDTNDLKQVARPPPVNSGYLPLPWKGRLGYACLNTYLRNSNPPVFSSRTCRIASIIEHRHPLRDPSQPEHPTKNRPDKEQPADIERGRKFVQALGLANSRDIVKMLRWNDKYGIKFMRLSSEMFPFASHEVYGYKLAPFASETLAEAGQVAGQLGHRLTTHPGQVAQSLPR